jgi:hypothetical protein
MNLFLYVVSTIGMAHIIVDGAILEWFRNLIKWASNIVDGFIEWHIAPYFAKLGVKLESPNLGSVVDCYLCCGTWCGFVMGYVWISSNPLQIFGCGCAGGFLANFAVVILNWFESATIVNLPQENKHES